MSTLYTLTSQSGKEGLTINNSQFTEPKDTCQYLTNNPDIMRLQQLVINPYLLLTNSFSTLNTMTQVSGVAMESKSSPPFSNLFMGTLRKDFVILQLYWWLFSSTKHYC